MTTPLYGFKNALLTLCELTHLPDIDFIVNHADGTSDPFYLTHCPEDQAPIMGWAKIKTLPHLILIPDYRSVSAVWFDNIRKLTEKKNFMGRNLTWAERKNQAFWRGAFTDSLRWKMSELSIAYPNQLDAGLIATTSTELQNIEAFWKTTEPGQGDADLYIKPSATYEEHMQFKYLPVINGVMCTYPGYQWRLLSQSLTMKQESNQIQWFYNALQPYVHYVPIKEDLSDLIEKINWAQSHDSECNQMAQNARTFVLSQLMFDDVYLYLYYVLIHYETLLDQNVKEDLLNTSRDPHWIRIVRK